MIKTYADIAAYDAAVKSQIESTLGLIETTNKTVIDGVNVITSQPVIGDILVRDENNKYRFIVAGTFQAGVFPAAWETLGVVAGRKGNEVVVCSKENAPQKWMDVYPYFVRDYILDGLQYDCTIKLHGSEDKDFSYTATTQEEFLAALQGFLSTNGFTDWSAYIMDGEVILQYDNYTSLEYPFISKVSGNMKIYAWCEEHVETTGSFMSELEKNLNVVWNLERAKQYLNSDQSNSAYNPSSTISSYPNYPICWYGFIGKSEHRKNEDGTYQDNCLWMRNIYCQDPANPTKEEWYKMLEDYCAKVPCMTGGFSPAKLNGKQMTDLLKDIKYKATDGIMKSVYKAHNYCSQFLGKGFLPSPAEFVDLFRNIRYGLSEVTVNSDPINKSLYAIGGNTISNIMYYWLSSRGSSTGANIAGGAGFFVFDLLYVNHRCVPCALLKLPDDMSRIIYTIKI